MAGANMLPVTKLLLSPSILVAISGKRIFVVDRSSAEVLHATEPDIIPGQGNHFIVSLSSTLEHLATISGDKKLRVWSLPSLELLSTRELPKKPTGMQMTGDGQAILVADAFGDVFSYPIYPKPSIEDEPTKIGDKTQRKRTLQTSTYNPHGTLVLGHVSILTSLALSPDEHYIITADRDEHVRVSWFPRGWNIESYCLGHEKFVSTVHIPKFDPETLISGGGDPYINFWDWMTGTLKSQVPIGEYPAPHLKVNARRKIWNRGGTGEHDAEELLNVENKDGNRKGKRRGKGKGKGKSTGTSAPGEGVEDESVPVFAIAKLLTVENEGRRWILFNATGCSALFYVEYPSPTLASPTLQHIDFGIPIIDMNLDVDGALWLCLDSCWMSPGAGVQASASGGSAIRILSFVDGELKEQHSEAHRRLSSVLDSYCRSEGSSEEYNALDLYSSLALLPKTSMEDGEEDERGGAVPTEEISENPPKRARTEEADSNAMTVDTQG